MIGVGITVALLLVLSGIAKAVNNTLLYHYFDSVFYCSKNARFWNPSRSWKNKYKDWDGMNRRPKFFGSTTFLAWTTDAWHLFDTMQLTCLQSAGLLPVFYFYSLSFWYFIPSLLVVKVLCGVPFEAFYSKILKKKK
jgi:hypothetical protein